MSKDLDLKKQRRVEIVDKYKKLGFRYCLHTLSVKSSSVKFYKTYSAAKREMHRKLENPNNLLSTIFELESIKAIF